MSTFAAINAPGLSGFRTQIFAGFRLLLCAVLVLLPFLSAPVQASLDSASVETSHHMHMSHDMTGHDMHHSHAMTHELADHEDCCDPSDSCSHEHCTMNAFQMFGMLKSAETDLAQLLKLSWANDMIAQRDGHRPLLDPPIP